MRDKAQYTTDSWTYRFAVAFGYLSIVAIILYEGFNLVAAVEGVETLDNLTLKIKEDSIDSIAWVVSEVLVGLEAGANVAMLAPTYEARRFLGIDDDPVDSQADFLESGGQNQLEEKTSLISCTPLGLTSLFLVIMNASVAGLAAIIPINAVFGLNSGSIAALVPLGLLSFAYQFLFVAADTASAYDECYRGRESVYAKLWCYSKFQAFRSFIEGFVMTNIYYCVMSSYVMMKVFGEIVNLPALVFPLQILAAIANVYTLTPRHEQLFRGYLRGLESVGGGYDLVKVSDENRSEAWDSMCKRDKVMFVSHSSLYGLLVFGVTYYFANKYIPLEFSHDGHKTLVLSLLSLALGALSFGFIFHTDWYYNMNQIATNPRGHSSETKRYSWLVKLIAAAFNFGAQATRGVCMVTFFVSVLGAQFSSMDLVMMALLTTVIVGGTNWVFYNPKLLRRIDEWAQSGCCVWSRGESNDDSYHLLKGPLGPNTERLQHDFMRGLFPSHIKTQ